MRDGKGSEDSEPTGHVADRCPELPFPPVNGLGLPALVRQDAHLQLCPP